MAALDLSDWSPEQERELQQLADVLKRSPEIQARLRYRIVLRVLESLRTGEAALVVQDGHVAAVFRDGSGVWVEGEEAL